MNVYLKCKPIVMNTYKICPIFLGIFYELNPAATSELV